MATLPDCCHQKVEALPLLEGHNLEALPLLLGFNLEELPLSEGQLVYEYLKKIKIGGGNKNVTYYSLVRGVRAMLYGKISD